VFLFSRIKEAHDDGLSTGEAVAFALERLVPALIGLGEVPA
jgi:hypothetical protein